MNLGEPVRVDAAAVSARPPAPPTPLAGLSPESFSLLALRLRADLQLQDTGRSLLIAAADDDAVGLEATLELAWCLAEELGHTVLLVDGAFGDHRLNAALGLTDQPGLAECLDAPLDGESVLAHLIQPTEHARIAVLSQGSAAGARTLRARSVEQLFLQACQRHEFVLVRGSLRADVNRSLAFCAVVDAALLIAVEEQTTWVQITRAQGLLNDCGARRVALVLAHQPRRRRASTGR